ncbi:molybdopterin-dependent oxidoreductase [Rhodospirillaceae bacterium KN72]|uniref:Molybdopterin-dependent oxidoreductase n=1 Tax=Pacificispira spongiicola TaxID=2729598 RepID=A0A7Y0E1V8_9PROT|nr:molybdopterin-dependent oxidoreductase [Pacificispira spongiicola]NMM45618.1 molybdopterin-dependent oxidoreductase [Pacificispira spongiicola]
MTFFRSLAAVACLTVVAVIGQGTPTLAGELPMPTGRAILTVSGTIEHSNNAGQAMFDLDMLKSIAPTTITTNTPWTEGNVTFQGVPITALLHAVGAKGKTLTITALNDYAATTEASLLTDAHAILAYEMNGERLSIRDKGPLWVIFPFNTDEALRTETYWSVSVWQVKSITIE